MTADQFFAKWINQYIDFDGQFGFQCMDLFEEYNKEVVLAPVVWGNAVDVWTRFPVSFYEQIANTPDNCPVKGDVVIWGTAIGPYGHIGICSEADPMKFTSFDQNWPIGSNCHYQTHNYVGVLGWLRPKVTPSPDLPPVVEPPQTTQPDTVIPVVPVVIPPPETPVAPPDTSGTVVTENTNNTTSSPVNTSQNASGQSWINLLIQWLKGFLHL